MVYPLSLLKFFEILAFYRNISIYIVTQLIDNIVLLNDPRKIYLYHKEVISLVHFFGIT